MDEFLFPITNDEVEAGSSKQTINATSHLAKAGDVILFTSGNRVGMRARVRSVGANTITTVESFNVSCDTGDTFLIVRPGTIKRGWKNCGVGATVELVAAVATKSIRLLSMLLTNAATAGTTLTFKSASTAISTTHLLGSYGGFILQDNPGGWLQTTAGEALNVTGSGGSAASFMYTYTEL